MSEQEDRESQKLWYKTAQAVKERNHELATDEKTKIEDMQRDEAARRAEEGVEWHPRLFREVRGGPGGPEEGEEDLDWILNANIDGDSPQKQTEQILAVTAIVKGQKSQRDSTMQIPPPHHRSESAQKVPQRAPAPQPAPEPPAEGSDLIDFGQHESRPQSSIQPAPHLPNDLQVAQTQNGGIQQKQLEQTLLSTSIQPANDGPLIDFHQDFRRVLPDGTVLKRHDTETKSLDEFVDAEG